MTSWFKLHPDRELYELCDPLAVAAAIQPDLLTYKQAAVRVETADGERLGQSVANYRGGPVKLAAEVDVERSKALIRRLLTTDAA